MDKKNQNMIFGIPSLVFWGILTIAVGTIIGSILIHKGSKASTTAIVKEDGDSTRTVVKNESKEVKQQVRTEATEVKTEVKTQAKATNKKIEDSSVNTNRAIKNQTKYIKDKIQKDGALTRNSILEHSGTKMLKEQLIQKLKPAISNTNEAFLQAYLNRNSKYQSESHNAIFTSNRPLRAEISNSLSLSETLSDEDLKNYLIEYLNRLKEPSRKFDKGLYEMNTNEILKKQSEEINRLEKEFHDIYKRVLLTK